MYSDVIPKSFSKSSPEENVGRGLNPPGGTLPLSFRYTQRGPKRGPQEPRGLRVTHDVVDYNKNIRRIGTVVPKEVYLIPSGL
tara:strand:- start:155 stop:403 length:249 start_codon:yes stop_codon:yes gene_type:complete